jgi:hypothetical protein
MWERLWINRYFVGGKTLLLTLASGLWGFTLRSGVVLRKRFISLPF